MIKYTCSRADVGEFDVFVDLFDMNQIYDVSEEFAMVPENIKTFGDIRRAGYAIVTMQVIN